VTWQATDKLRFNGAISVVDATYTERVELGCNLGQLTFLDQTGCEILPNAAATRIQNGNGKRFAPWYTGSFGVGYVQPISDNMEVLLRADASFRDKGQSAIDPTIVQPALQTLDLGATLRSTDPDKRWTLGLFVQNALDEEYMYYEFEAPSQSGTRIGFPAPPRRFTVRASWDF
jgi:outer membrane receptor protein involved in Fe transport